MQGNSVFFFLVSLSLSLVFCGCGGIEANKCQLPTHSPTYLKPIHSELPDSKTPALVVLPGEVKGIDQAGEVLSSDKDNTILFVHCRGNHPSEALNRHTMTGLAEEYNSHPVMFTWDAGRVTFPEWEAQRAAESFGLVLEKWGKYRESAPKNKKMNLLVHGIGSIVFDEYMSNHLAKSLPEGLFDSVVINASGSALAGHAEWVEKIDFAKQIFIIFNEKDSFFTFASLGYTTPRLGEHGTLTPEDGEAAPLAQNAVYVDLSQAVSKHNYYIGNNDFPCLYYFYNDVLNGRSPNLENSDVFTVRVPGKDYLLNK